jgi:3-phenylpropionate/trans-cinnamate dioxygenase ferredoxin reductase subunit
MFRPQKFFDDQKIELIADHAVAIDRAARKLKLASGRVLDYGHLVLATGARNRLLDIPNAKLPNVRYLRILDDSEDLRGALASSRRVVVIGAGFIGLEFAATARIKGLDVDVLELASRVMARAVTAEVSDYFQKRHAEAGVRIHLGVMATAIEADGDKITGVSLSDGRHIGADLVVVGVGVLPNVELAAEAGLPTASGIIVNERLLTADPYISAIGDCALFESPRFGGSLRLESVQNATDHARCVAARLTGDDRIYDGQPWFWSDQGDDKLQIAGLTTGYDQVVLRGDPAQKAFSAFCYRQGRLVGIESVNRAGDHMFGRRFLGLDRQLAPDQAADAKFDLKAALA